MHIYDYIYMYIQSTSTHKATYGNVSMIIIKTQHRNKNKFPHKNKNSVIGSTVINKTLLQETF